MHLCQPNPGGGGEYDFGFESMELWSHEDLDGYVRNISGDQKINIQWYEECVDVPDVGRRKYSHVGGRSWSQAHRPYA